ncbi:putative peptidase [Pseudoalteromonas luteoviolacea B = ATCC 29581]|nr:putative peptidase [Pseudoalteromonas luteoviolacea B = ATCC 29581]
MLKQSFIALGVCGILSACNPSSQVQTPTTHVETAKQTVPFKTYSAETFYNTTSVMGSRFNPNGDKILISDDENGIFTLYELDIKSGAKTQLIDAKETTYPIRYFPNDERILLTHDKGGNELYHVYVRELDGQVKDLTPGENVRASYAGFSKDSSAFYILTNERDNRFMDLYKVDAKTYERTSIYNNDNGLSVYDISPDGRFLALGKNNSNKDSDLFILDLAKEKPEPVEIGQFTGDAQVNAQTFSPDSKTLYFTTDATGEFSEVWEYDIENNVSKAYLKDQWDIDFVYFSESGQYRVVGVNEDASTRVTIADLKTNKTIALPALPAGSLNGVNFSNDEQQMSFYLNSDTSPSNLYVWQVGTQNIAKLTNSLSKEIHQEHLVSSTIERFKSFDGLEIPGVMYKPKQASATNKVPAVIWVHGGPGGQSRTGYSATQQHLVNHGYAIFAVNNRGSSGYGKTFFHLDDKKHGEDDLQDIIWGKKHLQTLDWVDPERIAIMGGSYGGYMTAAALTFTPDEFKAGINIFGVTNWERTLTSIPPWWESFKKALYDEMGDPATDNERHRRISPLFHAKNITKPLMVIQGANDPRVLQVESDELVEAVKQNNVPVEYVLFDDEGHGFTKKVNRITASDAYLNFLNKHL